MVRNDSEEIVAQRPVIFLVSDEFSVGTQGIGRPRYRCLECCERRRAVTSASTKKTKLGQRGRVMRLDLELIK